MLDRNWSELEFINNTYLFFDNNKDLFNIHIACFSEDPLLENLPEFTKKIYNEKEKEYVYSLRINSKYEEDYLRFLLGEYSNFTTPYRQAIYKLIGKNYKNSNIYKVIEKDNKLKQQLEDLIGVKLDDKSELTSIYDEDKETYKYDRREV